LAIATGLAVLKGTYYGARIFQMASKSKLAQKMKAKHQKDQKFKKAGRDLRNEMRALNQKQNTSKQNKAMKDALKADLKKQAQNRQVKQTVRRTR
jgi:preprotein translocase subunit SecF